jgi:hypothetical protein
MFGMRVEPVVRFLPAGPIQVGPLRDRVASARRTRLGTWLRVIARVCITYRRAHGRLPALLRPRSFTEKIQWRKLFELEPCFAVISDKLAARDFVAQRIGAGRQAALLWVGDDPDAIPFDRLVPPYVLKSTHAAGQTIIVRDTATLDVAAVRSTARGWLAYCFGSANCEPAYIPVPRRLVVERLLVDAHGAAPIERRVFVFNGRTTIIQTTVMGANGVLRSAAFHSRDWEPLPIVLRSVPDEMPPPLPRLLPEIIDLAERLGADLSHCRVDIYDCGDTLTIGEVTLYSWSGMSPFRDRAQDLAMGAHWKIRRPALRALSAVALGRWEVLYRRR